MDKLTKISLILFVINDACRYYRTAPAGRSRALRFTTYTTSNQLQLDFKTLKMEIEQITPPVKLGEGPHWDSQKQCLYFVSIVEKTIHKYVPETRKHTQAKLKDVVGFILPIEGTSDEFLVGLKLHFSVIRWNGEDDHVEYLRDLAAVDQGKPLNRLNDGKADPRGRVFAGTMGREDPPGQFAMEQGSLFRLDGQKTHLLGEGISIANGLAWDVTAKAFYYIDSLEYKIRRYDYNVDTGEISNKKFIFDLKKKGVEGIPDGMTIDTDGNLWVALYKGDGVIHVDPRKGEVIRKVDLPAHQVTSVTFGGPKFDELYVTSAAMTDDQKPPCGAVFKISGLGVTGLPNVSAKIPK